ncbi:sigma-70 family RNA polymerase sigma factor [Cytobacillus purgationiresistens]|uniref:RNA polymerase sigma factor (Sigma-70 family) n=1 Tax=Cytobacillus purgationiresistens TaxID=863449 RepID=A0ABU0AIS3_9BACI|nr:sigma-70 family RNA polymerase sigma factor [Cytobacillus purgationiresistens]MDQ0269975.1 RNA polymerase sigma factor (sigma-70 family) [Cytobacillus purgationiresistens]
MNNAAVQLFEENQNIIFSAIKAHFGDFSKAHQIAAINNMELEDLFQIGRMTLWNLCQNYDETREKTFKGYIFKSIRWRITYELHKWGLPMKIPTQVSSEERSNFHFTSVDLHTCDSVTNDYFAVDNSTDIESEVVERIELEEYLQDLNSLEKFIILKKCNGHSDREIGQMLGKSLDWVYRRKHIAISKINHSEREGECGYAALKEVSL